VRNLSFVFDRTTRGDKIHGKEKKEQEINLIK
jgi:hypothetical protein